MEATPEPNAEDDYDELFTDAAWENMNALLDREMPVKKKRNRGFLMWWNANYAKCMVAAFALLLGMGIWRTFTNITQSYEANNATQNATNQSVTTVKSHVTAQLPIIGNKEANHITTSQYDHKNATLPTKKRLEDVTSFIKHQPYPENKTPHTKTFIDSATLPISSNNITDSMQIIQVRVDTSVASAESQSKNGSPKFSLDSIEKQQDTHTLPALPFAFLENIPIDDYIYAQELPTMPQKSSWWKRNVKVGMNSVFNVGTALMGGELGIATTFRLTDKTVISVGLSGMRRNYRVAFQDSSITKLPTTQPNPVSSMNLDSNTTCFATNIAFNSLHLPIVFSRRVSKNWSLGAGITPTFYLVQSSSLVANTQNQITPQPKSASINTSDATTQADWSISDIPAKPTNFAAKEIQYFYTNQIQQSLRRLNISSGLYATCALDKLNIVAGVEYNILGYNTYNNTGHSIIVKVGVERNF